MPVVNACVHDDKMVNEHECKVCTRDCRHAGELTTAERNTVAQLREISTASLVEEIVRRGHGAKHFIQTHDEFSLRSHKRDKTIVHAVGTGPVLFLAIID